MVVDMMRTPLFLFVFVLFFFVVGPLFYAFLFFFFLDMWEQGLVLWCGVVVVPAVLSLLLVVKVVVCAVTECFLAITPYLVMAAGLGTQVNVVVITAL